MRHIEKLHDLMSVIQACIDEGRYLDTRHVLERQEQRVITRPELLQVLRKGYHEKRKDKFDELYSSWNYSVRGKTVDRRDIRVIVSFDENEMLIITAIEIGK